MQQKILKKMREMVKKLDKTKVKLRLLTQRKKIRKHKMNQ